MRPAAAHRLHFRPAAGRGSGSRPGNFETSGSAGAEKENLMNWDRIEGNWKQLKGRARAEWGKLTDDDVDVISGRREQLVGKLQERYGIARDDAEHRADSWIQSL